MVRLKSRYLLCEVCVSDRRNLSLLDDRAIYTATKAAVARAHGDYGAALSSLGFSVKYLNAHTGIVFLRCRKSHYRLIWSALPFITSLENRGQRVPCFLNCLHVGGTIRTCQKFLVRYNTQQLHRMLPLCQSEAERSEIRKSVLSCTLKKRQMMKKRRMSDSNIILTLLLLAVYLTSGKTLLIPIQVVLLLD